MSFIKATVIFLFSYLLFSNVIFAQDFGGPSGGASKSKGATGPGASDAISGVKTLANNADNAYVGAAASTAMGTFYVVQAKAAEGSVWGAGGAGWYYVMAGLEFTQAGLNVASAGDSSNAAKYIDNTGLGLGDDNGGGRDDTTVGDGNGGGDGADDEDDFNALQNDPNIKASFGKLANAAKELKKLEKKGYKFNKDTGETTLPDGSKLSLADVQSKAGASGILGSKAHKKILASLDKKRKSYLNRISRLRAKGGGGYLGAGARRRGKKASKNDPGYNFNSSSGRKIASVPLAPKIINGEPLAMAEDNVFHIVQRAYEDLVTNKVLQPKLPKK